MYPPITTTYPEYLMERGGGGGGCVYGGDSKIKQYIFGMVGTGREMNFISMVYKSLKVNTYNS